MNNNQMGVGGAFHSRDSRLKQRIHSTEFAVERALALGLDSGHPILEKASRYIQDILHGRKPFPDYHEKNDRWPTGTRLFLASTLALIEPEHPLLVSERELWIEIARRTFQSGGYSQSDEMRAHAELTLATMKGSYLHLFGRYQLNLIGSRRGMLPHSIESALLALL